MVTVVAEEHATEAVDTQGIPLLAARPSASYPMETVSKFPDPGASLVCNKIGRPKPSNVVSLSTAEAPPLKVIAVSNVIGDVPEGEYVFQVVLFSGSVVDKSHQSPSGFPF